ncbi:hypothetical protein Tco_1552187, partial [Tanacetum coccineum]
MWIEKKCNIIDSRTASQHIKNCPVGTSKEFAIQCPLDIHDLDKRHSFDLAQKAKIQWAIEGDESSKYFHGIINKKRSQLAIRGVLVDGEWIEDPPKVKNEFLEHFSNRFSMPT